MCHSENAWQPSTFNHDVAHFPIYSGKHNGVWNNCAECHTVPGDLTKFSCTNCHINPETNNVHTGVPGYAYNDNACFACHPTGDADQVFNHNQTNFPLTGAHITADCIQCHQNGYEGTTTICMDCHLMDYNQAINPNHITLGIQKIVLYVIPPIRVGLLPDSPNIIPIICCWEPMPSLLRIVQPVIMVITTIHQIRVSGVTIQTIRIPLTPITLNYSFPRIVLPAIQKMPGNPLPLIMMECFPYLFRET